MKEPVRQWRGIWCGRPPAAALYPRPGQDQPEAHRGCPSATMGRASETSPVFAGQP